MYLSEYIRKDVTLTIKCDLVSNQLSSPTSDDTSICSGNRTDFKVYFLRCDNSTKERDVKSDFASRNRNLRRENTVQSYSSRNIVQKSPASVQKKQKQNGTDSKHPSSPNVQESSSSYRSKLRDRSTLKSRNMHQIYNDYYFFSDTEKFEDQKSFETPQRKPQKNETHVTKSSNQNAPSISFQQKCKFCYRSFKDEVNRDAHRESHIGAKSLNPSESFQHKCNFCYRSFKDEVTRDAHQESHLGAKPYHCNICDKYSASSGFLKRHSVQHISNQIHRCIVCRKMFNNKYYFDFHTRSHWVPNS